MALTLPQPEFPVFNGDLIEYCDFIRAFENPVERYMLPILGTSFEFFLLSTPDIEC